MPPLPETKYLQLESGLLAYQAVGHGARTTVAVQELAIHLDLVWTDPTWVRQWGRVEGRIRSLVFQPRGVGLSDPVARLPTPQEIASDVIAVMDAEGVGSATLLGTFMTAPAVLACAATYPGRVEAVVVWNPLAQGPCAPGRATRDLWPDDAAADGFDAAWRGIVDRWGTGEMLSLWDPVIASPRNVRLSAMLERTAASPAVARQYLEAGLRADVIDVLPHVRAPVVVLWTPSTTLPEEAARAVADLVRNGVFETVRPSQPEHTYSESWCHMWDRTMELIAGEPVGPDRHLASLLFTDVVGSTELVAEIGDAAWQELRVRLESRVRTRVEEHGGELIKLLGDGSLSVFPTTRSAIRSAWSIQDDARALGLGVRAGVHAGEVDRHDGDIGGLAVHVTARVAGAAGADQTFITHAALTLANDSDTRFAAMGEHELKGVPGRWELFAAHRPSEAPAAAGPPPRPRVGDRMAVGMARRVPSLTHALLRLDELRARRRRSR